jgi:hypothetical protein
MPIVGSPSLKMDEPASVIPRPAESVLYDPAPDSPNPLPDAREPGTDETEPPEAAPVASVATSHVSGGGHIFVSYKSEDRQRARILAQALERRGWPVWWDRDIQAGQAFRRVIAQALDEAACTVVLWTELSIESEWVQEEAQEAKARHILVPALLDEVHPPLGFGQMQSAWLVGWSGEADDPMLDDLLRAVATHLGLDEVPPLLGDESWAAIVESERVMRGKAAAARSTEERAAAAIAREDAEQAASERVAASDAGHKEVEVDAARREALAIAAADSATKAAEEREAEMAAELAAEHAAELRAMAARRAGKEAEARAAEEAAERTERERQAARTTGEREIAAHEAEREASLRVAQEAAHAAERNASRIAAAQEDPKRWAASGIGATEPAAKASWFRFPREGVATLLGAILVGVSAYLPWAYGNETAFDNAPLEFLLGPDAAGNVSVEGLLGWLLVAVAIIGGVLALFRVPRWITVILGAAAATVALWFLIQVVRTLDTDATVESFFQIVSIGPAVTIAGGLLMLSGR